MNLRYQEGWTFLFFPPSPIYRKRKEKLATQLAQASSAHPGELGCFLQKQPPFGGTSWKAQVGLVAIWTPILTKYTPALFWWFFFRKVTETYEFRNDTCFLSVMLRNLTDYVIIHFFPSRTLRNFTDCALTLPFNFRHVTELHWLCYNAFFWLPACHRTSRIA